MSMSKCYYYGYFRGEKKRHCESKLFAHDYPAVKWLDGTQIWVHMTPKPIFQISMLICLLES